MADRNSIVEVRIPGTEAPATPKRETQFVTILDLLRNGTTDRLDTAPPVSRGVRAVPELVFIHCCHLGRIEKVDDKLPPNVRP